MSGRSIPLFGGKVGGSRSWARLTFWPFGVALGTAVAPVGVPLSYKERVMTLKVHWESGIPPSGTWLVLTSVHHTP